MAFARKRACESRARSPPWTSSAACSEWSMPTRSTGCHAPGPTPVSGLSENRPCTDNRSMKVGLARVLFAALVVGGLAVSPSAALRPPKLQYDQFTLANGLTVVLSEDHSTPIVHLQLWYHVGSKNEKKGRTGFAHLFEHMMFKGSKNVAPEEHTSQIVRVGGRANAYTTEDETVFWETFPQQYLPMVLWMEADRMATLRIDE